MPILRSATSTQGRNMAGARALWRATGMKEGDFGKPIIAVVNSFTTTTTTSAVRGLFQRNAASRAEVLSLIRGS